MRSLEHSLFGTEEPAAETAQAAESEAAKPLVYYIAAGGAPLYREPGRTVIVRVPEYRKVYRYRLENGYAYVRLDGSADEGWVDNAKLIWHLPSAVSAPSTQPAASGPAPPAAADESQAPAAEPPAGEAQAPAQEPPASDARAPAAEPGSATPSPTTIRPSVFNPY